MFIMTSFNIMKIEIIPKSCTFKSEVVIDVNLNNAVIMGEIQINAISVFSGVAGEIILNKRDAKVKDFIMVRKKMNRECVATIDLDTLENDEIGEHTKVNFSSLKISRRRR